MFGGRIEGGGYRKKLWELYYCIIVIYYNAIYCLKSWDKVRQVNLMIKISRSSIIIQYFN